MKKRILSMLLVLVLMATLVPLHADAAVTIYWPVPDSTMYVGIGKRRIRVGSPPKRKNRFRSSFRPTPSKSKIIAFIRCACSSLLDLPR